MLQITGKWGAVLLSGRNLTLSDSVGPIRQQDILAEAFWTGGRNPESSENPFEII